LAPALGLPQEDRLLFSPEMAEPFEFSPAEPVDYLGFSSVDVNVIVSRFVTDSAAIKTGLLLKEINVLLINQNRPAYGI
jgi:hypothetical protein